MSDLPPIKTLGVITFASCDSGDQELFRCRSLANKKSPVTEYGAGQKIVLS